MSWITVKTLFTILILLLLPGWAILAGTGYWRKWNPLQRWFLAICLGISFWPILFYLTRAFLPFIRIGDSKILLLLLLSIGLIVWKLRKNWKEQFELGKWGWLVLIVLGLTLLTRLYIADQNPYLAGDDALHHVLLTEFTSRTGILPFTLEPYGATSLDHYHLGLYALTAPLNLLSGIGSDQAVLWMSQFFSGICGIGVFLVLDKKVSRSAALIGMLTAGLLSPYPSWFSNWSRFTQLTAQTILLPAALVYWESISITSAEGNLVKIFSRSPIVETVFLVSSVCLTHFRVAGFLLPLITIISVYELVIRRKTKKVRITTLILVVLIGVLVFLVILPALLPGLRAYLEARVPEAAVENTQKRLEDVSYYSQGDRDTIRIFKESSSLLLIMLLGITLGLLQSNTRFLSILILLWIAFLILAAYAYKLNIYILVFTNITAVILLFYLPISIGSGLLVHSIFTYLPVGKTAQVQNLVLNLAIMIAIVFTPYRLSDFEPRRAFMTEADQKAMNWIKKNIPQDAVFAVNISFLNPTVPYGTDAGYWLPYYAERETTTLTLISGLDGKDPGFPTRARASLTIYENPMDVENLCAYGITHLFSGVKPPLGGPDLSDNIKGIPGVNLIYDLDGVEIYQICGK